MLDELFNLVNKINGSNNSSFTLDGLLNSITGGGQQGGRLMDLIKGFIK
jgi:hypothetical protein